jgi:GR25 family glycosyltransferase involved in LPS biosynthesis
MRERFAHQGMFAVERRPAVDGKEENVPPAWVGMEGGYGCLRSHMQVVGEADSDGCDSLLVFEDDVEFAEDIPQRIDSVLRELPHDWSFLYLGGFHRRPLIQVSNIVGLASHTLATFAYAIRRPAFEMFLDFDLESAEAIDLRLSRLQTSRPFHCVQPNVAWVDCDFSDIQGSVSYHWYIKESLVIGDECDADLAGRVVLVVPRCVPAWREVDHAIVTLITDHFRQAIPDIKVIVDDEGLLPSDPVECARRVSVGFDESVEYFLIAGSPVLFSRSHLLGALQMCRTHPAVSPFSELVQLSEFDTRRVLSGQRKAIDLTAYRRERCNGLELGWGFFRRVSMKEDVCPGPQRTFQVPSFALGLGGYGHPWNDSSRSILE